MADLALRLFGTPTVKAHALPLPEGTDGLLVRCLRSGTLVLETDGQAPASVLETADAYVVVGTKTAVRIGKTADRFVVKPIGEAAVDAPALDEVAKPVPTKNEGYGFFGEMSSLLGSYDGAYDDAGKAYKAAFVALAKAYPKFNSGQIRAVLDSKVGRWIGEKVANVLPNLPDEVLDRDGKRYEIAAVLTAVAEIIPNKIPPSLKGPKTKRNGGFTIDAVAQSFLDDPELWESRLEEDSDDLIEGIVVNFGDLFKRTGPMLTSEQWAKLKDLTERAYVRGSARSKMLKAIREVFRTDKKLGAEFRDLQASTKITLSESLGEDALDEASSQFYITFDIDDVVDAPTGPDKSALMAYILGSDAYQNLEAFALGTLREELKTDKRFMALLKKRNASLIETQDTTMPVARPRRTPLREDDYAEIKAAKNGLELYVNGALVATEECDFDDALSVERAQSALGSQAEALGYVEEGTFDASNESGGAVVNGDKNDDWLSGESAYERRLRRRTMAYESTHPFVVIARVPAGRSGPNETRVAAIAESVLAESNEYRKSPYDAETSSVAFGFATKAEATAFCEALVEAGLSGRLSEAPVPPQFRKGKKAADDEDEGDDTDDEEEEDDEDAYESVCAELIEAAIGELLQSAAVDENVSRTDVDSAQPLVSNLSRALAEGDFEGALLLGDTIAHALGRVDEYKRMTGGRLAKFRRSLKTRTGSERQRNKKRRMAYKTNSAMRMKAKRYRIRTRRFRRAYESAENGASATGTPVSISVLAALSANPKQALNLPALSRALEGVEQPRLMGALAKLVQEGTVTYDPATGYMLEVADDVLTKLARAARSAGNRFVVTLAGTGTPMFVPTVEDQRELWKSIPPKLRGLKTTLGDYLKQLGVEEDEPTEV